MLAPRCFWEGDTGPVPPLNQGWVLAPREISTFLDQELPRQGLSDREILDFKSYWVPRLKNAPYYRIEFLPKKLVDFLCPIELRPKVDTLIRVHMRAYAQEKFELLSPPERPKITPRKGLTIVEWGGMSHGQ